MSFDLKELREAVARHGRVVRVVVAEVQGSAPREAGAAMLVWEGGQSGTIGGGALEWEATLRARRMLGAERATQVDRMPLGPALQQCCGGAVTLVSEVWDASAVTGLQGEVIARRVMGAAAMPMAVSRILSRARDRGDRPGTRLVEGWLVEPVLRPRRAVWVWGAGHVGRAIVGLLAPLPGLRLTWIDTAEARFPETIPAGVAARAAPDLVALVPEAPADAEHFVLTFSHVLDLALCDALLRHGFRTLGLIGSATKAARFRSRLAALGHSPGAIARIDCPIGDPALGKHPQAIAVGVAAALLQGTGTGASARERAG